MKNTNKSIKSIRRAMIISTAAIIICLIGIIIEFVTQKRLDTLWGVMLGCNSVILLSYLDEYQKLRQHENAITSAI